MQNTINNIKAIRKAIAKLKQENTLSNINCVNELIEEEYTLIKIIENNIGCSIPPEYQSKIIEETISKGGKVLC